MIFKNIKLAETLKEYRTVNHVLMRYTFEK
jgi:hypothetical protein